VIGGTGHTGTYPVLRVIEAGHQVAVISRKDRPCYPANATASQAAWERVGWVEMDRAKAEEAKP
jgi:nucleoside-diphosphate-sugar epimerase